MRRWYKGACETAREQSHVSRRSATVRSVSPRAVCYASDSLGSFRQQPRTHLFTESYVRLSYHIASFPLVFFVQRIS